MVRFLAWSILRGRVYLLAGLTATGKLAGCGPGCCCMQHASSILNNHRLFGLSTQNCRCNAPVCVSQNRLPSDWLIFDFNYCAIGYYEFLIFPFFFRSAYANDNRGQDGEEGAD
jgi:hypothetical protein